MTPPPYYGLHVKIIVFAIFHPKLNQPGMVKLFSMFPQFMLESIIIVKGQQAAALAAKSAPVRPIVALSRVATLAHRPWVNVWEEIQQLPTVRLLQQGRRGSIVMTFAAAAVHVAREAARKGGQRGGQRG